MALAERLNHDEGEARATAKRWFRRRLPHGIPDDRRLSLKGFFLVAYRARQTDDWSLRQREIAEMHGLGEDGFYETLNAINSLGYIKRTQKKHLGEKGWEFGYGEDTLDLSAAPPCEGRDIRSARRPLTAASQPYGVRRWTAK